MLRKLHLSVLLPVVQVTITAVLTLWAYKVNWILIGAGRRAPGPYVHLHLRVIETWAVWRGVNAPTFPVYLVSGGSEILNLAAVAVLWYLVGRFFDRRKEPEMCDGHWTESPWTISNFLIMVCGACLLVQGLHTFREEIAFAHSYHLRVDGLIVASLFLLWSLILLVFLVWKLAIRFRRKSHSRSV